MADLLVSVPDFQRASTQRLSPSILAYYNSGAGTQLTLGENCSAFNKIHLKPRCLVDVSQRSTACRVLGFDIKMPIAVAPTAMHRMAHPDGEIATARAAGAAGTIFVQSIVSTYSIEEVAAAAPDTIKWMQLYIYKDRLVTEQLIRRAEAAGFKALVLTVDAPTFGIRRADLKNRFRLPDHLRLANFSGEMSQFGGGGGGGGLNSFTAYGHMEFDDGLTWTDVQWLLGFTNLPVIVKGILSAQDAVIATDIGCSGIIVSNHGARQLDTVQATIDALPAIAKAVGHRVAVMMDGGIREGGDVFKAIAYGAQCVFVGRPVLWGLAVDGQPGVERVLHMLHDELDRAMALSGTPTVSDITVDYLVHRSKF